MRCCGLLSYNVEVNKKRFIVGIDEVGRGPLAGPVAVGAVAVHPKLLKKFKTIKDSKQLSEKQRALWDNKIRAEVSDDLRIAVTMVSAHTIDRLGITMAIKKALTQSIAKLGISPHDCTVLLDGGLRAPMEYTDQKTIIHGDAKEPVIAMASVVAKVKRDKLMQQLSKKYPLYHFTQNKGYGTQCHREAIQNHGLSTHHRKSFCRFLK